MDAYSEMQRPFDLDQGQRSKRDMVQGFVREKIAPYVLKWNEDRHLPLNDIGETAALSMGGICVFEDVAGSAHSWLDSAVILEALAKGCPAISSFNSTHNMAATAILQTMASRKLCAT